MNMLIPVVALVITRDPMTILPREVPKHEVAVVQAVFGEDNVEVKGEVEGASIELDSSLEADRLVQRYGQEAVEKAYGGNFKGAIDKECKAVAIEASNTGERALTEMSKAELLAHADELGVSVDQAATKAKIIEAIQAATAA